MLPPKWCGSDLTQIKKAYRRASASVHPDKNSHPQAVDAFRKVTMCPVDCAPRECLRVHCAHQRAGHETRRRRQWHQQERADHFF